MKSFADILDEASSAKTVVQMQRSAARLAQAYETIFQRIIQRLGAKLLSKLSRSAIKKMEDRKNGKNQMTDARRAKLVDDSYLEDDARKLDSEHLDAEIQSAAKARAKRPDDGDYDAEVSVPNSPHTWKRVKGTKVWCRSSAYCTVPHLDPQQTEELEAIANRDIQEPKDTEDMGKQLTEEVGLDAPTTPGRVNLAKAVADAKGAGFVSQTGDPIKVDLAVQRHTDASDVRAANQQSGSTHQSAHDLPSSVGKQDGTYSRGQALTVLLPTATHRAFDDYWKKYAIQQRQKGVKEVPVSEFMDIMYKAIDQTPGISKSMKGNMQTLLRTEVYRDLGWNEADMIELPYPNIR
ncbi:MAG: hypothetical protein IPG86_19895 [Chitinophagaceae bacterium]|nr:hypothetical protein [Chitinophagaceae bacterium]